MAAAKKTTVKVPQDHKPKATEAKPEPMKVTVRDHEWEVDPATLDDFELLSDLAILQSGGRESTLALTRALPRFLGPRQMVQAMELLRDKETGRVPVEAGTTFFGELFEALNSPNS